MAYTLRTSICFELIFIHGTRYGSKFIFLTCGYSIVPASFIERIILCPLNCNGKIIKKSVVLVCVGLFMDSI